MEFNHHRLVIFLGGLVIFLGGLLLITNLLLVGAITEEEDFLEYLIQVDNLPSQIDEGLYLGSFGAASNIRALKELNITHVLTVANSLYPPYSKDFTYRNICVEDNSGVNLSRFFNESFAFIDQARMDGGRVLVHCLAGISRSATVVIAYMMDKHSLSLYDAFKHVESRRSVISPNPGFVRQLKAFEKSLRESRKFGRDEL